MTSDSGHKVETEVQRLLDEEAEARRFELRVVPEVTREEDDWVYIAVAPSKPGIRAYDFVELLGKVEAKARAMLNKPTVLIVPAAA